MDKKAFSYYTKYGIIGTFYSFWFETHWELVPFLSQKQSFFCNRLVDKT
jgi:hypothetical protein